MLTSRQHLHASAAVMEILGQAIDLEAQGHKVCHLEVGQPQSGAPKKVLKSAEHHLRTNRLGYTNSQGAFLFLSCALSCGPYDDDDAMARPQPSHTQASSPCGSTSRATTRSGTRPRTGRRCRWTPPTWW